MLGRTLRCLVDNDYHLSTPDTLTGYSEKLHFSLDLLQLQAIDPILGVPQVGVAQPNPKAPPGDGEDNRTCHICDRMSRKPTVRRPPKSHGLRKQQRRERIKDDESEKPEDQQRLGSGWSAVPVDLLLRFVRDLFGNRRSVLRRAKTSTFSFPLPHKFPLSGAARLTPCGLTCYYTAPLRHNTL